MLGLFLLCRWFRLNHELNSRLTDLIAGYCKGMGVDLATLYFILAQ